MRYSSLLGFLLVIPSQLSGLNPTELITQIFNYLKSDSVSSLASLFSVVGSVIYLISIKNVKNKYLEHKLHNRKPIKITAEIDGKIVTIEAENRETAGGLLKRFQVLHPEIGSSVKPKITYGILKMKKKKKKRKYKKKVY